MLQDFFSSESRDDEESQDYNSETLIFKSNSETKMDSDDDLIEDYYEWVEQELYQENNLLDYDE